MAATVVVSAEAFDATTVAETASFAISGSDRVLYVRMFAASGSAMTHTAVRWGGAGGVDLTQIGTTYTIGSFLTASLWRLIAPSATTETVIGEVTGASFIGIQAVQVQDANQTTPNGTVASNSGTNTTPTVTATTVSGDLVLDFPSWADSGANNRTISADGSQTSLQEIESTDLGSSGGGVSRKTASGTSTAMSWTLSGAVDDWHSLAFAVNGTGGGAVTPNVPASKSFRMRVTERLRQMVAPLLHVSAAAPPPASFSVPRIATQLNRRKTGRFR